MRGKFSALVGLITLAQAHGALAAPPAVQAAPAPAVQAVSPAPANTVRCVFDNLSIEDREITLMLIGLDFISLGRYSRVAPENKIVDRIVLEAVPRCAQAHRWSPEASAAAVDYAHSMLVQEVVRQALDFDERKVDPIESYYTQNRAKLAGKPELDDLMEEGFATHLKSNGYKESDRGQRRLARVYLEVLIARDNTEQRFSRVAAARAPVKPPKRRAKTASRGRP